MLYLDELLNVKPGELIKGVTLADDGITSYLNKSRWSILPAPKLDELSFGEAQHPLPGILVDRDITTRVILITYIKDNELPTQLVNINVAKSLKDVTFQNLEENSHLMSNIYWKSDFYMLQENEIVGMSLGETILFFLKKTGTYSTSDRFDSKEIICYHRILNKEKVVWIRLITAARIAFDRKNNLVSSSHVLMELA